MSAKKTYGEVFSPPELVDQMLDTLPSEVWSNPTLRWLDPCVGHGAFVTAIVFRLMRGLCQWEPDDKKRYKHILENMVFACELQFDSVRIYSETVDPDAEYDLNIFCGSYLDSGFDDHFASLKFNVIVMNPPYQRLTDGHKKSRPLWQDFVRRSFEHLTEGGYLVAVHPSGWRNVDGVFKPIQQLLKSRQMLYLEIHDMDDGRRVFRASTRYDFYCLRNAKNDNFVTTIKGQDDVIERVDISKLEFVPNGMFAEIFRLLARPPECMRKAQG
jgi:methylase of polypeptide subunit release factors